MFIWVCVVMLVLSGSTQPFEATPWTQGLLSALYYWGTWPLFSCLSCTSQIICSWKIKLAYVPECLSWSLNGMWSVIVQSGISPLLAKQLKEYTATKASKVGMHLSNNSGKQGRLVVIGQEAMEPLDALRKSTSHPASLENVIRSKRRRGK